MSATDPASAPPDRSVPAWSWIPSLYFGQGIPYVVVMTLSVVMYKNIALARPELGITNTTIALYTSWLYLPWVIKPLWSPLVDLCGRKRTWIVLLQGLLAASLAAVALTLPGPFFFRATLAVFWLMAFASATHDIAADGFYLLALSPKRQASFVGVRSTFYRLAMIAGSGGLVYLAGQLETELGDPTQAWTRVFYGLAGGFALVALWHAWSLPRPAADVSSARASGLGRETWTVFAAFFRKPGLAGTLAFLLLYRFGEAQLVKLITPFLLDGRDVGGLALTTSQVGVAYGTYGVIALTVGGLLGGWLIARYGLRRMLWPMALAMNLPNLVYVALAATRPESIMLVTAGLATEQFGYGIGFAAYLVFMMRVAEGPHRTAHYALCTGFMALGMMLPGMVSGWLQAQLGYLGFFIWVVIAALPSLAATAVVRRRLAQEVV